MPVNLQEAADIFQLNAWQKFWRLEVPFAMPDLIWNMMMSMSGSWVFLIQSEAIYIAAQQVSLPGVGSYIQLATVTKDVHALFYAVITMLLVILMYDQLLFRPLVAWSDTQSKLLRSLGSPVTLKTMTLPRFVSYSLTR